MHVANAVDAKDVPFSFRLPRLLLIQETPFHSAY